MDGNAVMMQVMHRPGPGDEMAERLAALRARNDAAPEYAVENGMFEKRAAKLYAQWDELMTPRYPGAARMPPRRAAPAVRSPFDTEINAAIARALRAEREGASEPGGVEDQCHDRTA